MEQTIYLLGTSHAYQGGHGNENLVVENDLIEFSEFIRKTCCDYKIKAVCEEMRPENLDDKYEGVSIPKSAISTFKEVKHKYCDPSLERQETMGIVSAGTIKRQLSLPEISRFKELKNKTQEELDDLEWRNNCKREPCWLERVQDLNVWPILFICGSDHVPSFGTLIKTATLNVCTIAENWKPAHSITNHTLKNHPRK